VSKVILICLFVFISGAMRFSGYGLGASSPHTTTPECHVLIIATTSWRLKNPQKAFSFSLITSHHSSCSIQSASPTSLHGRWTSRRARCARTHARTHDSYSSNVESICQHHHLQSLRCLSRREGLTLGFSGSQHLCLC